jgi:hypothetical protein
MKVSELFESSEERSVHSRVYRVLNDFALNRMKLDAETKSAARYEASNDRFWTSYVDEVTRAVEKYLNDPSDERLDEVFDAFVNCVEQISEKIVDHYSNSWNHAPGYKKPAKLEYPSVENIRDREMIAVLHTALPEFKVMHDEHQAVKKEEAKQHLATKTKNASNPEMIQKCAAYLNKLWPTAFSTKDVRRMQRKPKLYTDWFTVDQIKAFSDGASIVSAFKTDRDRLEWVLDSSHKFPKDYDLFAHIINTPALRKKLVPLLKPTTT